MATDLSFPFTLLAEDRLRQISSLPAALAKLSRVSDARKLLADQLSSVLHLPVALLRRAAGRWVTAVETSGIPGTHPLWDLVSQNPRLDALHMDLSVVGFDEPDAGRWTCLPIGDPGRPDHLLLLPGNWTAFPLLWLLERFAREVSFAMRIVQLREASLRHGALHMSAAVFARKLSQPRHQPLLGQFVVDTLTRAAGAEQGVLALHREEEGGLTIEATSGYPRVLVEHLKIRPGAGVLGGVFSSRRPLLVADVTRLPNLHAPRVRYRTTSFMAVPLIWCRQVLGVVSVADRADGRPFEGADLKTLRVFGTAAALALARARLECQVANLRETAAVDPLTNLFNRRYLSQQLQSEIERARRYKVDLALLLVDIDHFKSVNDRFGHTVGDALLREVADVLRRSVRAFDVACRYGGEEFVIALPGTDADRAVRSAERVRRNVEAHPMRGIGLSPGLQVTVSVGVSTLRRGDSPEELIARADRALYEAKRAGRNHVRLATD